MPNIPENLKKFFKQIQKLYERDTDFQTELDNMIENGQVILSIVILNLKQGLKLCYSIKVKSGKIVEKYDSFNISIQCPKFIGMHNLLEIISIL